MTVYRFGPFALDPQRRILTLRGVPMTPGPKVIETLAALVENAGQVLTKNALLERIWPDGFVEEGNLSQNVYVLRKIFRANGFAEAIQTIPRTGYRFTLAVGHVDEAAVAHPAQYVLRRRIGAGLAGAAFLAASILLAAGHDAGRAPARASGALSAKAAGLYQAGFYYWNLRTRAGVLRSLAYFGRVVDADPTSARGYAALANANIAMGDYCYGMHLPAVYFARAREYAEKALALDPRSAEAHAALGFVALYQKRPATAIAELNHAIAIDPSFAPAHEWRGIALLQQRDASGYRELKTAAKLDPLSVATIAWLGSTAYAQGRFDEAITYSRQALELSPQRTDALITIGKAYEAQGELPRAIAMFKRYGGVDPYYLPESAALLANAYARAHAVAQAQAEFTYARAHASDVYNPDLAKAAAAVGTADAVQAARGLSGHPMGIENAARETYSAV